MIDNITAAVILIGLTALCLGLGVYIQVNHFKYTKLSTKHYSHIVFLNDGTKVYVNGDKQYEGNIKDGLELTKCLVVIGNISYIADNFLIPKHSISFFTSNHPRIK